MLNWSLSAPRRTLLQCGIAAVSSVALMSWLRIRPLGVLFLALFGLWFYKTRCNLRIVVPPELQKKYENLSTRICEWRHNQPAMFCAVSSGCLGALAILGHLVSGSTVVIVGLVLAAILSTKYNFKLVKIDPKVDFAWSEKLHQDAELDDEFLPEVNESNLFVLQRAGDLATLSSPTEEDEEEDKSDEVPSELLIPDPLPEIDEASTSDDDVEDLLPMIEGGPATTAAGQNQALMEFKKGHFNRDTSSSEESLSRGLQFPDHTTVDAKPASHAHPRLPAPHNMEASEMVATAVKTQTQALLASSGRLLPSLVSGLVQWGMGSSGQAATPTNASGGSVAPAMRHQRLVTSMDSSDESDFEILESDDFK